MRDCFRPEGDSDNGHVNSYGELSMPLFDAFLHNLSVIVGEECWGVVCDEGSGTVLGPGIGERLVAYLERRTDGTLNV